MSSPKTTLGRAHAVFYYITIELTKCFTMRLVVFVMGLAKETFSLNLGKKGLELTAVVNLEEIIASANMALVDKDVGDGALSGQFLEVTLDSGTILFVVQFKDKGFDLELLKQFLGLGAIGAVRL
jgi:hypothetical protein